MPEDVAIRVEGGHIHRATKAGEGVYLTGERCNIDDALLKREISPDELANAEPGELCLQPTCFPPIGEPTTT